VVDACQSQAVFDRLDWKRAGVLLAGEPLFLERRHQLAVGDDASARIMEEIVDAKDFHFRATTRSISDSGPSGLPCVAPGPSFGLFPQTPIRAARSRSTRRMWKEE